MITLRTLLCRSLVLAGLSLGLTSCLSDGYIGVSDGIYYGPHRDPWFHDDPWMDGHHWYGRPSFNASFGLYLHPPRGRR